MKVDLHQSKWATPLRAEINPKRGGEIMMRSFLLIAALMLTNGAAADDHAGMTPGDGAFNTIMLQTSDLDRYTSSLKSNLQV